MSKELLTKLTLNSHLKNKHTRGGSRIRSPKRSIQILSDCAEMGFGKP